MPRPPSTSSQTPSPTPSWVAASGLLTGCAVTLIGVLMQLSPERILLRAVLGGTAMAIVTSVAMIGWKLVSPVDRSDDS